MQNRSDRDVSDEEDPGGSLPPHHPDPCAREGGGADPPFGASGGEEEKDRGVHEGEDHRISPGNGGSLWDSLSSARSWTGWTESL